MEGGVPERVRHVDVGPMFAKGSHGLEIIHTLHGDVQSCLSVVSPCVDIDTSMQQHLE